MLGGMAQLLGVVLVGAIALPAHAAPRPKGKVVRVERARGAVVIPRVCDMQADKSGMCLGTQPLVGEMVMVLDETGVIAQARIVDVSSFATGIGASLPAGCNSLWRIKTEVVVGDLSTIPMRTIGVVDPEVHPRKARMYAQASMPPHPNGSSNEKVLAAIDRNGDGNADILLTQTACDDGAGQATTGMCVDEWARVGGKMAKVQQTNFSTCGF